MEDWFGVEDLDDPFMDMPYAWGQGAGGPALDEQNPWREYGLILVGALLASGLLALVIRRIIMLRLRNRRLTQADTNAAAIDAWYYLSRLTGPDKQNQLSKDVKELVYKARFSQHRLTEKERVRVVSYTRVFADEVYEQSSVFTRFLKKYILGL